MDIHVRLTRVIDFIILSPCYRVHFNMIKNGQVKRDFSIAFGGENDQHMNVSKSWYFEQLFFAKHGSVSTAWYSMRDAF